MEIDCVALHSDKSQTERMNNLSAFKEGLQSLLVCTGILGRGHDIPRVKYVINYDMPNKIEDYVHRIGRTGRAGETGFALTFVSQKDEKIAADLVQVLKSTNQTVKQDLEDLAKGQAESDYWAQEWKGQDSYEANGGDYSSQQYGEHSRYGGGGGSGGGEAVA